MTCIVYRDGILAADTQISNEAYYQKEFASKIWEDDEGNFLGAAQDAWGGIVFKEWWDNPHADLPDLTLVGAEEDFTALVIYREDRSIELYNRYFVAYEVEDKYIAIGSGGKAAIVALDYGATAVEAVEAAMKHDLYTGGEVEFLEF